MKISVLGSGSRGNCIIVEDTAGNQIMLDCGLKYEAIIPHIDIAKFDFILVSHEHGDHIKGLTTFRDFCFNIISYENVEDGKQIDTPNWKVLPMQLEHNVECFGFLIYNKVEKKKLVYITDTIMIPKFKDVDCAIIECNWDEEVLDRIAGSKILLNHGYLNHLSKQQLLEFFETTGVHPKNLVLSHLSNSGLINVETLVDEFKPYADNVVVALKGVNLQV